MAVRVAKRYKDELERLRTSVEDTYRNFSDNMDRFHKSMRFIFQTQLTTEDKNTLDELQKPQMEFNVLEAYISRLRGEFSKQQPSVKLRALNDEYDQLTMDVLEAHMRSILFDANNDQFENEVYKDQLAGGYSVMKLWTEYENEDSFNQNIRVGKLQDPTMAGFDPLARLPHKGDGKFCFELFPMEKERFEEEYPNIDISNVAFSRSVGDFNWGYRAGQRDVILICDYYEKKLKKKRIHYLAGGMTADDEDYKKIVSDYENRVEQPPQIVKSRTADYHAICRYRFITDQVIEYIETDYKHLPLVFVDGNSATLREDNENSSMQVTRPYIYNALDSQRLKNFAGISLANELENVMQSKMMAPVESIPEKEGSLEAWINHQKAQTLLYNPRNRNGEELPQPTVIPRTPIPAEITQTFMGADQTIQNILGSYDAQLGIQQNQLSGIAIVEGATQSNAAAMPYVMNFLSALNQVAQIIIDLIPKYYVTPRTIPIVDVEGKRSYIRINEPTNPNSPSMLYPQNTFDIRIEAGVNFEVQKNRSLQTIISLMGASEGFKSMMEQYGLPILVDNLDIRGADQLKRMADAFTEQLQQQRQMAEQQAMQGGQAPNPEMIDLNLKAQKQQMENEIAQERLILDRLKLEQERDKLLMSANIDHNKNAVQLVKAQTEREAKAAELAMDQLDLERRQLETQQNELEI